MKKLALGVLAAVLLSVGVGSASVNAAPPQTDITGVVTENGVAMANAQVSVLCDGNTQVDTTDSAGSYLVVFPIADCPFGNTAKVTAQKDGKSGTASGTVQGITTKLNLAIVNVSVPEYGLIGMILAAGAGVGMIAYSRRQQQSQL